MKKVHHFLKSHLMKLAICMLLIITTSQSVTAFAYDIVTTQVTVDDANWQIVAGVVTEDVGAKVKEVSRIGSDALETLAGNNGDPGVGADLLDDLNVAEGDQSGYESDNGQTHNLVLSFPGKVRTSWGFCTDSTEYDKVRASAVKDVLLYSLNSAYDFVYEGQKPDGIESYKNKMVTLLNLVSKARKGYTPTIYTNGHAYDFAIATDADISKFDDKTMDASDYVVISCDGKKEIFAYRIPKGYIKISDRDSALDTSLQLEVSSSEDATYITWGEYAYEAFATYVLNEKLGLTASTVYAEEPGALESALVWLFSSLSNAVSNILGLWSIDELILNAGVRGGAGYIGGVFPASWEPTIWTFFYIMEVLALIVLSFAILAGIYKRAMSTVNPVVRASFMEQVKNICVAILILIMLPIIFRLMLSTSATLTEISASALGDQTAKERFAILTKNSGTLGGCILQLVYLCSLIYFNFFYYLRSLIVVALIVFSPLLVMAYTIGDGWKNLTTEMFKILISSIFIQPIQALCLTLILLLPVDGRGFQSIIAIYALIPLTNMLRDVVFKGSGSGLHAAAKGGGDNTVRHMKRVGAVTAAGGIAAVGATAGAITSVVSGSGAGGDTGAPSKAEDQAKREEQQQQQQPGQPQNKDSASQTPTDSQPAGSSGSGTSSGDASGTESVPTQNESRHYGKRILTTAAGVTAAGVGGALNAMGFRNGLQQMGKGAITGAIVGSAKKTPPSNDIVDQKKGYENESIEPNIAGNVDGDTAQQINGETPDAPVDVPPSTPDEIGRNIINGEMSADALAELEQTDLRVDGIRVNSDESEFKADEKTMSSVGVSISKPKNLAERGSPPQWDRTHNRTITYSAGQLSQVDQANLAAAEQVFRSGDAEKMKALQDSGIQNVTAEYQIAGGKKKPVEYKVDVSDTKKFKENYDIDLNDQWRSGTGEKERGMSTQSGSFVPKVINNEKVKIPIIQKMKDAPQNPNIVDPSHEEGGDYPEKWVDSPNSN